MPLISARIVNLIKPDTAVGFAEAGEDQSVFCASVIQLQGQILGDDPALHTFEWEQTFGTPVTLINPNTLFPTFINPQTSDIEFTLYVDRGTPFETSDTVFISRRPSSFNRTMIAGSNFAPPSKMPTGAFSANTANSTFSNTQAIDVDFAVGAYSYNYPPDSTYSLIYKAEDLRRIKDNLGGKYWLMRDVDMSELNYPWDPLGTPQRPFSGELQGNGFSIQNLSITSTPVAVDGGDGFYDSVTMNNDFEGTNGQQTYTGTFGDTWTFDNQAQISSNQAFSGSTSVLFDGSGDRMYTSNAPGLFGSGDFTIEFYAYPLTDTNNQFITNVWSGVNNRSWSFDMGVNNNLAFLVARSSSGAATLNAGTNTINENEWTHVVAMRKGTGLYLFRNGVLADQTTIGAAETIYENGVVPTTDLYIGRRPGSLTHYNGHIDLYRLTAAARYPTTGFAPPTEFPDSILKPAGLFSYIGNGALIEEVGVTNANISGVNASLYKGVLAGSAQGPSTDDGGTVTIRNCYVEGTVDSASDNAGGLIGHTGTNVSSTFENTYSDVTVTGGGTNTGGWAGNFQTEGTYNDNFWDSTKTAAGVGTGGDTPIAGEVDSLTTAQLQVQSNYTNWDFDTVWQMPELKDNIGPAQLQNNIFGRVVNDFGASLETGTPQAVLWKPPNTATNSGNSGSDQSFRVYKGAIIEDQNPVTLGWENRRFIPAEQASALMTSGRRHRAFMVYDVEPNIIFNPATKIAEREVAYLVPETVVERGTGWPFAGGTSKYIAQVVGSAGGAAQDAINITITNPRKIALTVEDPILSSMIVGSDDFLGGTSTATLNYFVGTTFNSPDLILGVTGVIGGGDEGSQVGISITRAYGGTIG